MFFFCIELISKYYLNHMFIFLIFYMVQKQRFKKALSKGMYLADDVLIIGNQTMFFSIFHKYISD